MNKINVVPAKLKAVKLLAWNKVKSFHTLKLGKNSKAAVAVDNTGTPQLFLLDTRAFLDILSEMDEALVDRLSTKEYNSKSINPAGWLIDEIESKLPLNPKFVISLKKAIKESNKKGWVPFSQIQVKLGLS